jgi:hypothetical protein
LKKDKAGLGIVTGSVTCPGRVTGVTGVRVRVGVMAPQPYPYPESGYGGSHGE